MSSTIEQSIEIRVPVRTAYDQWTQFEQFPRFMDCIESVKQVDDQHLLWQASIDGKTIEWRAQIVEQIPDKRISWKSLTGPSHAGVVTFHRLSDSACKLMFQMDYEPDGLAQNLADSLGVVKRRVAHELEQFRELLEARGAASGAWRGEIPSKDDRSVANSGGPGS